MRDGKLPGNHGDERRQSPSDERTFGDERLPGREADVSRPEPTPKRGNRPNAADAAGRSGRIQQATSAGGLTQLPPSYDVRDGDWTVILSDDCFEVLFLDSAQPKELHADVVRTHFEIFNAFWSNVIRMMDTGAARAEILRKYGGDNPSESNIRRYPQRLAAALKRLDSPEKIAHELEERHRLRRRIGAQQIAGALRLSLRDGSFEPDEAQELLIQGLAAGLTEQEVKQYALNELIAAEFEMESGGVPDFLEDVFTVRWITRARAAKEESGRRVMALRFRSGEAKNLPELLELCDAFPDEAADHLMEGTIDTWVSSHIGDAFVAREARTYKRALSKEPKKALELFARMLAERTGHPVRPSISLEPGTVAFGQVPVTGRARIDLTITPQGRAFTWGAITISGTLPGVKVPSQFVAPEGILPIRLTAGAEVTPGSYSGALIFAVDGGSDVAVPISYTVVPVVLRALPDGLNLRLKKNSQAMHTINFTTVPAGGWLLGSAELNPQHPGLSLITTITGETNSINLLIDSTKFSRRRYDTSIHVQTNAGELQIPVKTIVKLTTFSLITRWLMVAVLMWGIYSAANRPESILQPGTANFFVVVTADELNVRHEPERSSQKVGTVTQGSQLRVVQTRVVNSEIWFQVQLGPNTYGWLNSQYVQQIDGTQPVSITESSEDSPNNIVDMPVDTANPDQSDLGSGTAKAEDAPAGGLNPESNYPSPSEAITLQNDYATVRPSIDPNPRRGFGGSLVNASQKFDALAVLTEAVERSLAAVSETLKTADASAYLAAGRALNVELSRIEDFERRYGPDPSALRLRRESRSRLDRVINACRMENSAALSRGAEVPCPMQ